MNKQAVKDYLTNLQASICNALTRHDGAAFAADRWQREEGGGGESRVLEGGGLLEKAGVNFSHVTGTKLPPSATAARPQLAGRGWEAMGVSLVLHPYNPYLPTTHANVRFFVAEQDGAQPIWWFGGGFDLTPYYPFDEDVVHWHRTARAACQPFGDDRYARYKKWCDEYFYLRHRNETRGVGGLFFDDLNETSFDHSFAIMRSVGDHFLPAYEPIIEKRRHLPFTDEQVRFQHYRRGRYVEFNLVYDRGTLFGLQSGGRTESILMSLPPQASWRYDWSPLAGSDEARLQQYLQPREWLAD